MKRITYFLALAGWGTVMFGQHPHNTVATGPAVGTRVPDFRAVDQMGRTQDLKSIIRQKGALLVFFRSADW